MSFDFFAKECFTSGYSEDNVDINKPRVIKELQLRKLRISHISGDHPPPANVIRKVATSCCGKYAGRL